MVVRRIPPAVHPHPEVRQALQAVIPRADIVRVIAVQTRRDRLLKADRRDVESADRSAVAVQEDDKNI